MSDRKPIARLSYRRKAGETWTTYSIASVWPTKIAGLYDISRDKGTDRIQVVSLIDAIKAFVAGDGAFSLSIEAHREQRGANGQRQYPSDDGFGGF